ncbi:MAG: sulfatase-like hydrolase/transferase, partial [Planctomycetota bacterium]
FDAHAPYAAPLEHLQGERRSAMFSYEAESTRREYLAEVTYADAELGRLLRGIPAEVRERTLVVFTSDHGEGLGEHGEFTHSRLLYEGTLRVPLVLSNPKLFPDARVVSDRVVGLVDVTPTVLSMLGIASEVTFDGLPLLHAAPNPERAIYSESMVTLYNHGWAPLYASTRLADKFVLAPAPEYYNLRTDGGERTNLFAPGQPVAQSLGQQLRARLAQRGLDPTVPSAAPRERELDPQQERWLSELGYSRGSSGGQPIGRADPKVAIRTWARLSNASNIAQRGETAKALAEVEDVLAKSPEDLFALEVGFQAASFAGDDARAEAYLRRRLANYPTPDLLARLGALLVRTGRPDEALAQVDKALAQHPRHGELFVVK